MYYVGKKFLSLLLVFTLVFSMTGLFDNQAFAASRIITVKQDGTGDYTTINDAAQTAQPGDTIVVYGGTYRETVTFPREGNGESSRITLKAASGQKPVITGSNVVTGWAKDSGSTYKLVKDSAYFGDFNPFATKWQAKGSSYSDYFSCGCVYINGTVMSQVFKQSDVYTTPNSWYADIKDSNTTISANFNELNPADKSNSTEINVRKQCITAKWNQGYITIDGLTITHGCGPKTIVFWQTAAKPMDGAIATNGGHNWIIQNCDVTQNRGVAIDYGNGSRMLELQNGGEPKLYGHHIIRYCNVHDNGTNGMMAYRGAYTEIYGNTLYNNNALNTGLLSEAYIKDVSGGFGINIHNNYFYSDQDWAVFPIWLDSECDGCRVSKNLFYCKGNGHGFTYVDSEVNHGWQMYDNNIFVGVGLHIMSASHNYFVNNLWLNIPSDTSRRSWPGIGKWGFVGSEGWDGYQRAMRVMEPGTLDVISTVNDPTSRFETYNRFNKMLNNIFFDNGLYSSSDSTEVSKEQYNSINTEVVLSKAPNVNPDYSGGSWSHPEVGELPIAWVEAKPDTVGKGTIMYGNECDYNVYYGGAQKIGYQYASARGYEADKNSKVVEGGTNSYQITATPDSFKLTLNVDGSCSSLNAPAITGAYLGNTELYQQLGYNFYAPDVNTDYFGNARDSKDTVVGPFANLKAGSNTFDLWPAASTNDNGGSHSHHSSSNSRKSDNGNPNKPDTTFVSDTTKDFQVNGAYQFRITSQNGAIPNFVLGTSGVFYYQLVKTDGNDYYFKLIPVGKSGAQTGIYVNGVKLLVATVGDTVPIVKSDTPARLNVRTGNTYIFKLTSDRKPVFLSGNSSVFQTQFVKASGTDYYFMVKAIGKPGTSAGFYINDSVTPSTVGTVT
ncbi:right-handed parallel beta-helix repeat-containing protein [Caproiciproducens galactitolivorans]|uniref:Right-handed parallel beta-helix repeat-containing protein n=1 Tax=Caproiciproducens galactitolivorans TaxID=642589 RepID=A0ABT4BU80_9FIRM|nr:right-handed parallel beta-helix repeat-containing protein [Caproiciproducens galactitolivorans]MCY1714444.1 right-handed parallel beta-helix repeat-containing protein [Caproiciproducens galactitolivorans]